MQKQIIVPLATAVLSQAASAITMNNGYTIAPVDTGILMNYAQTTVIGNKCVAKAEKKATKMTNKCAKQKTEEKKEACRQRWSDWLDDQRDLCTLPCQDRVDALMEDKQEMCQNAKTEEAKQTCLDKADTWLTKQTLMCCKKDVNAEFMEDKKECRDLTGRDKKQCIASAKTTKREGMEQCNNPDETEEDDGEESGEDNGEESGEESGEDNGEESGEDNGEESGEDNGEESGEDNGEESGEDNGEESGEDNGEDDGQDDGEDDGQDDGEDDGQDDGQDGELACEDQTLPELPTSDNYYARFNQIQLCAHNKARALHHDIPMVFDAEIASQAQAYAEWMKDEGVFEHSERSDRQGQGENLYYHSAGIGNTTAGSDRWYAEEEFYHYTSPGTKPAGEMIGHFTQMVWKESTELGCGFAGGYMVCRYKKAGNVHWRGEDQYRFYIENVPCPTVGERRGCPA